MKNSLAFDPLLPIWVIITLTVLMLAAALLGDWKGLKSSIFRSIAAFALCGALLNPQKLMEERTPLPDIAVILTDTSDSMQLGARAKTAQDLQTALTERLSAFENTETIVIDVPPDTNGTYLTQALIDGLGQLPADRIAGVFAITDGQVHDLPTPPSDLMPEGVPFHSVIVGEKNARDRRLEALITPKYGLVSEQAQFEVKIEDLGHEGERAQLEIRLNGELAARVPAIIGNTLSIPVKIEKRGINTVEIRVATAPGELTPLNNFLVAEISGIRDRLRVLLVTGEPHMGGRAWRNLLKSDPSVDLVQFTILTVPGQKTRVAREGELSLIQFPVRELFEEKITEFDLVIFDQFKRRTMSGRGRSVPMINPYYLANVATYVENGGALLIATGAAFAGEESLARSPLIAVLPARPTGELDLEAFRPDLSAKGKRHPITSIFAGETADSWGRWYRSIDVEVIGGDVLMVNDNKKPLLIVDKVKKGRTAMLLSDQAWLWAKGHDGGGPYNEMFRRLAHWLMGEPDLEADRLLARIEGEQLFIDQYGLEDKAQSVTITRPDGSQQSIKLKSLGDGHYAARTKVSMQGAYRVENGALATIAAMGSLNPAEYKHVRPSADILQPLTEQSGGQSFWVNSASALPKIRKVKSMTKTANSGFADIIAHERYDVTASRRTPFGPTWLYFLIILLALLGAWRFEGR